MNVVSESPFLNLARAAETSPETADFLALRRAYMASDIYRPTSHYSSGKLMGNTNGLGSFEEVAAFCTNVLEHNPMDLEARMLLDYALQKTDKADEALRQKAFIRGMLAAIFQNGDGKSFESAWQVVAVAEEYTVLSVLGLKSSSQQLTEHGDQWFDVLQVSQRGKTGEDVHEVYFDITTPFLFLQNMLR